MRIGLGPAEKSDSGQRRAITDGSGEEIGFVEYEVSEGWLEVRWVELAVEHRRGGLGVAAVRLLEVDAERRWGVRGVRAEVPVENGLALYFWLRLGYRPCDAGAGRGVEVLVMERYVSAEC
jgi:ribosomal protein S18 acetylase RimI-like enzyme